MPREMDSGLELTVRELQILELVALGYSAKEVAQEIEIAPRTVECHIDTMRLKMRARNRTHMVAIAISSNILVGGRLLDDMDVAAGEQAWYPVAQGEQPLANIGPSLNKIRKPVRAFRTGFGRSSSIFES
jgi:LuxR family transcriptional regulator, transcriptional regulator of spore coat protein